MLYYSIAPTRPNRLIDVAVLDSSDGVTFRARRVTNRPFLGVLNIEQFDPLIAPTTWAITWPTSATAAGSTSPGRPAVAATAREQ